MVGVEGGLEDQFNVHIIGLYDAKKSQRSARRFIHPAVDGQQPLFIGALSLNLCVLLASATSLKLRG